MRPAAGRRQSAALVLVIAAALYIAPLLLDAPLTDPDEGLHAAISQEMLDRGDFVVPRFLGTAFLDKPILFFWAQAASIAAFGATTAAARLPGMLFALLGIATTGWLARVLAGSGRAATGSGLPATGWIAAACYATMALPFMLAQAPVHDIALVPFTNAALGLLWSAGREPAAGSRKSILAGVALGLSILTKGLEGVAIVGVAYGLYLLLTRSLTWRIVGQGILVLAIAALVALPWYLAMNAREPGYLRYYFFDRHLLGFATDTQRHGDRAWWFYLPVVLGGGLPWIAYVRKPALADRFRSKGERAGELLLWTWLGGAVLLLSLSGSKAITYVLPVMPAIAILAAASHAATRTWRPVAVVTAATFAIVLATAGPSLARTHSARDLADFFNRSGRLPANIFVMDQRVSFVYYLRPELRRSLRHDQVRNLSIEELAALNPFPPGAVLALPADLADRRVAAIPALAHDATRMSAGRYLVIAP